VKLLEKHERLPNLLHIGYDESLRLLGERAEEGPVMSVMNWAYGIPENDLLIINIRDWHDTSDPAQKVHLSYFGNHCIKDTPGAEFAFSTERSNREDIIINASGLNDFIDTKLSGTLDFLKEEPSRIGLIGVWTEAKISFLAYELSTRYPDSEIAICSALCASSSRSMHFIAIDQLKSILGIRIFSSIGAFTEFLTGSPLASRPPKRAENQKISFDGGYTVSSRDSDLLRYLYRDAKNISFKRLDGGFSGNVVVKAEATDVFGHLQVPTVVKIGDRDLIARERSAFERIQEVLGNNAPNIVDFAEIENRGGIKYRYAAMLDGEVKTFQKFYAETDDFSHIGKILETVFVHQLGRLYSAATLEKADVLELYDFSRKYAKEIRENIENTIGAKADGGTLAFDGIEITNVLPFYENDIERDTTDMNESCFVSYVHGDLNGANIIIDSQENVWIIDYFHTGRNHVIRDLVKLENDILYIFTKIQSEDEFAEARLLTDELTGIEDLGVPLDDSNIERYRFPQIRKARRTIGILRSFHPKLVQVRRDPFQLHVALLRYAMHTLSFDESNSLQKKWALYTGSRCVEKIRRYLRTEKTLRIDFIEPTVEFGKRYAGKLGITILPGRKDRGRNLSEDIGSIKANGIDCIICMISGNEFAEYGVDNLKAAYADAGFDAFYLPVLDQKVPAKRNALRALKWIDERLSAGQNVLIHCVGGLGRSGTLAAAFLAVYCGAAPDDAIEIVRRSRSPRAVETREQAAFVRSIAKRKSDIEKGKPCDGTDHS
jgi:protein-tyrosine phosphatase